MVVIRDMVKTYPEMRVILMSATIDTTLFSNYFGGCPVIEVPGRAFSVKQHFLEDCVEMLKFNPPPDSRKRKRDDEASEEPVSTPGTDEQEINMNKMVSNKYSPQTRAVVGQMAESEVSFELIEALLVHIKSFNMEGAVLVFLPGWNLVNFT